MLFYEIWTLFSLFLLSRRIIQCLLSYLIFLYLSILLMHPRLTLLLGCGIAGYSVEQVAPWFAEVSQLENVYLPHSFRQVLEKNVLI